MNINISKELAVTLAAWATVIGFFFLLFSEIGALRADVDNVMAEQAEMRQDIRELRQILVTHLQLHAGAEKIALADADAELPATAPATN